ncbi:hypothetical protein AB0J90_24570 [Micromonospora sp. NPDC049523]|uniref:DUF2207 family protein n=1 Tax=Micromonospora sp. NPDC049523 TaxID=3155921 RepID=UPI003421B181
MNLSTLAVEAGLPTACVALFVAGRAVIRLRTRPAPVTAGAATMNLPGPESPAVVSLLVNRWRSTVDAAESSLLDLAARGHVELRQTGPDPRHATVHPTGRDPAELDAYERQVLDRVVERAVDGVVPLTALGFADADRSADWTARLGQAVIAAARRLGLSRPRFSPAAINGLRVLGLFASVGITLGAAHYMVRSMDGYHLAFGVLLISALLLWNIASGQRGERHTSAGREAAARWLGVRDWIAGHGGGTNAVRAVDFYLVLDDGRAARTRAWILPAEIGDRCRLGDVVSVRVRPWTCRVVKVTVHRGATDPDGRTDARTAAR